MNGKTTTDKETTMTDETTQEAEATDRPIAVTRDMLTEALTEFYLTVRDGDRRYRGQVSYPAEVADALYATLSRIVAERAPDAPPWADEGDDDHDEMGPF